MFQYQHNLPVDATALAQLFERVGWYETDPGSKLEWVVASSEEWVTCTIDGELVGFGRTFRLDAAHKLVFDVVVDARFEGLGVDDEIIRMLAGDETEGGSVMIFRPDEDEWGTAGGLGPDRLDYWVPEAPPGTYLG
jgi:hypothetical protein